MLNVFKKYLQTKGNISEEQFELVTPLLAPLRINKGAVLLKQGEACHHFSFVAKGCLRSYISGANGKIHILEFAPENRWLGDAISLFTETGSLFSIDAVEDSQLFIAGKDFYTKMPGLFPEFHIEYIQHMHASLRTIQKRIGHLLGSSGHERYIDFLENYPELGLRLPQHMIASYLGISPESLSRIRHRLSQK